MTDEQIIIDGIDVSKCEFLIINNDKQLCRCIKSDLFGGIEFVENAKNGNCKDNPNCYYKQLKRKEEECERLKEEIKHYKQIAQYHGNLSVKYTNKSAKLKQTLAEIEKQVKAMNNECFYSYFDCMNCDMKNGCTYFNKKQILQKISECEVENG